MTAIPSKQEIEAAHTRIEEHIHRTPLFTSETINRVSGAHVHFKCENLQKVGAFKIRGATNAVLSLTEEERSRGIATHSSGNHAQAIALAGRITGTRAYVVMPSNAPLIKRKAVIGYGADVIECEPTLEARESTLAEVVERTGASFIHPYNDLRVIAGQATCAKEIIDDYNPEVIFCPVGGGGLLSGTLLSSRYFGKNIKVIAAEPKGADDAYRSWKAGQLLPSVSPDTIADGLLTSLGSLTFPIIQEYVEEVITVTDEEIISAMRLLWERMKLVVEPSGAVTLAALLQQRDKFEKQNIAIILSGGNVDLGSLPF